MSTSIVLIITSVLMLAFGLYRIWKIIGLSRRISAGETWPVIAGNVVSKQVVVRRSSKSGPSYHPEIRYKYAVMGQEYERRFELSGIHSRSSAEEALAKIGDVIEVRYNPEKPAENVTGQEKVNVVDIVLVVCILGLSIYLLIRSFL